MNSFSVAVFNNDHEIAKQTIDQLNKDFNWVGVRFNLPTADSNVYQDMVEQISDALNKLATRNSSLIPSLLYRIDLPEEQHNKIIITSTTYFEQLADMILRRECFKVITRINFSRNG